MKTLNQKLLAIFKIEQKEHSARIRAILDGVGESGALAGPALDEAFRRAHSLKGAARAVNLGEVEQIAHRLETLLAQVRSSEREYDAAVSQAILEGLDSIDDRVGSHLHEAAADSPSGQKRSPATDAPAFATSAPHPVPASAESEYMVRIETAQLDEVLSAAEALISEAQRQSHLAEALRSLMVQTRDAAREAERLRTASGGMLKRLTNESALSPLAAYVNFLEQQLRSSAQHTRNVAALQQRISWDLQQLTGQLHESSLQARMIPADTVFDGFRFMVRDLARAQGKEVHFESKGMEVRVDRRVLEALKDPAMHMLRNAVSHAIESPEVRVQKSKSRSGNIKLTLRAESRRLILTVEDDGAGIDFARVAKLAAQQGLLSAADAAVEDVSELAYLLFAPGFSTAKQISEISGRGMGLNVVYETVSRLQGHVEILPNPGGGTVFRLTVPLNIATQRLMVVECGGQRFAIPAGAIHKIQRVAPARIQNIEGKATTSVDGSQLPLISLRSLLGMPEAAENSSKLLPALVIKTGTKLAAILVDAFLRELQTLVHALPRNPGFGPFAAGAIMLEDGLPCVVLNPAAFFDQAGTAAISHAYRIPERAKERRAPSVLVVDDSMTTRALEKNILEAHGYEVAIATDGLEALERLREGLVDLIVTDLEMPRLDGFGLLEELKKDEKLARIPVIIVSSLERKEDQARGLALGADAYIVKRTFEQRELLETVQQII